MDPIQKPKIEFDPRFAFEFMNSNGSVNPQSLGYDFAIQTVTEIFTETVGQSYFTIAPEDFVPIVAGFGAYMENVQTTTTFTLGSNFSDGDMQSGENSSSLPEINVGMSPIQTDITYWAKQVVWNTLEVQKAMRSLNWDFLRSLTEGMKEHADLGIQLIAFLGKISDQTNYPGLLTQLNGNVNTALITGPISSMNAAQFSAFVAGLIAAYRINVSKSEWPDTFVVPENDYLGLQTLVPGTNGTYPTSMLSYLEMAFKGATHNPNFRILPCAYAEQSFNAGYWAQNGTNRYLLYKKDPKCLKMLAPLPFAMTPSMSANGFQFQGVAQLAYSGVTPIKPATLLAFDWHS